MHTSLNFPHLVWNEIIYLTTGIFKTYHTNQKSAFKNALQGESIIIGLHFAMYFVTISCNSIHWIQLLLNSGEVVSPVSTVLIVSYQGTIFWTITIYPWTDTQVIKGFVYLLTLSIVTYSDSLLRSFPRDQTILTS